MTLPVATVEGIVRSAGVNRISSDATAVIIEQTEKYIKDVSAKAFVYTQHAGRSTLKGVDVEATLGITANQ